VINRVILVGNLTRDAEPASGPTTAVTRMRVATNSVWRDGDGNRQESSEFHNVVAFGRLAEVCSEYCVKGRRIYIEGRLRTREYDGADGVHRYATEVVADTLKMLDRPPSGGGEAVRRGEGNGEDAGAEMPPAVAGSGDHGPESPNGHARRRRTVSHAPDVSSLSPQPLRAA
jgi:single-strand DNA-binding protein